MDFTQNNTKEESYPKVSIIVPCYNEEKLVGPLLEQLIAVAQNKMNAYEIVVVNDGSTDSTARILHAFQEQEQLILINHSTNLGKGASIKSALNRISGDIVIIQDADREYDPTEIPDLIKPILENRADVVYGSRFLGGKPRRAIYFTHAVGNKVLTTITNLLSGLNLTDMETGYKAFKSSLIRDIDLKENRFGIEPEITMKLSKIKNIRFYELGISYYGRTFSEGKKISWKDGIRALMCIIKYKFSK